ncbi:hypothetical protein [Allorhizocola rhizosphaerae]|uniref:hypothetical protein n=1 Tax=Allorhizocola rhizosphaerae TaxID=1872709 RepID=UPI0013C3249F|nr:hypothetical protein [Allorhizocola rhizosphaerae]
MTIRKTKRDGGFHSRWFTEPDPDGTHLHWKVAGAQLPLLWAEGLRRLDGGSGQ